LIVLDSLVARLCLFAALGATSSFSKRTGPYRLVIFFPQLIPDAAGQPRLMGALILAPSIRDRQGRVQALPSQHQFLDRAGSGAFGRKKPMFVSEQSPPRPRLHDANLHCGPSPTFFVTRHHRLFIAYLQEAIIWGGTRAPASSAIGRHDFFFLVASFLNAQRALPLMAFFLLGASSQVRRGQAASYPRRPVLRFLRGSGRVSGPSAVQTLVRKRVRDRADSALGLSSFRGCGFFSPLTRARQNSGQCAQSLTFNLQIPLSGEVAWRLVRRERRAAERQNYPSGFFSGEALNVHLKGRHFGAMASTLPRNLLHLDGFEKPDRSSVLSFRISSRLFFFHLKSKKTPRE